MAIEAAYYLPQDVLTSLKMSREAEKWSLARDTLDQIIENADIAKIRIRPCAKIREWP